MRIPYVMLDLKYLINESEQQLHPVVLFGREDVVLVDCGYPGSLEILEAELGRHGIKPERITKLLLTHQDDDHMGAAAEIKKKYPAIEVIASGKEKPYISGELKNLRLQQAEELQKHLPDEQQKFGLRFCERLRSVPSVSVDGTVSPGEIFDWGGGCEILATPGHTPGHISIGALNHDFMITGDAAVTENRSLAVANPEYCLDIEKARQSLEKLIQCRCRRYICYHGGMLNRKSPAEADG